MRWSSRLWLADHSSPEERRQGQACGFAVLDPDLPAHCVDDKRAPALPIISGLLRYYQFLQTNLRIILDTTHER